MQVMTNCYLAVLKKFKTQYPDAHFEVITRTAKSVLAPSWELLELLKKHLIFFEEYKELFIKEIRENPEALKRIEELREIGKERLLFLVCYEKDQSICHRSIVKEIINKTIKL